MENENKFQNAIQAAYEVGCIKSPEGDYFHVLTEGDIVFDENGVPIALTLTGNEDEDVRRKSAILKDYDFNLAMLREEEEDLQKLENFTNEDIEDLHAAINVGIVDKDKIFFNHLGQPEYLGLVLLTGSESINRATRAHALQSILYQYRNPAN